MYGEMRAGVSGGNRVACKATINSYPGTGMGYTEPWRRTSNEGPSLCISHLCAKLSSIAWRLYNLGALLVVIVLYVIEYCRPLTALITNGGNQFNAFRGGTNTSGTWQQPPWHPIALFQSEEKSHKM